MLSETRPEYVAAYAALASLGITALTLNIRMHPDELRYCIETGKPAALLTSGPLTPLVHGLRAGGGSTVRSWICFDGPQDGFLDYAQLLAGAASRHWRPMSGRATCTTCSTPAAPPAARRGR